MGYPYISFAGKAAKLVMSTLAMVMAMAMTMAMAVIVTASSSAVAHGKEAVKSNKRYIVPSYAARDNTVCIGCKSLNKGKDRRDNRNPQNLSVSKDFKFYKQVDSLDLADPGQADILLRFMDIRLAEKKLDEEVLLVSDNESEIKEPDKAVPTAQREKALASVEKVKTIENKGAGKPEKGKELQATPSVGLLKKAAGESEKIAKPKRVYKKKVECVDPLKDQQKDRRKTVADKKEPVKSKAVDEEKEKEQARVARTMEQRKAREQANPGKQIAGRVKKKQEHTQNESVKKCHLAEKSKEEAARLAKQQAEQKNGAVQKPVVDILPNRTVAYQIASDKSKEIINFDQTITQRFKTAGSYLDRGEYGNNIVKDKQGREFLNVMAFWDVLVEPQNNGENHYYGSIQFPLGSRHPAIIKSTKPGDTLAMGCQANEVVVLKGFETEGVDYQHGLIDTYLAHSVVMPDGTVALQEVVHQPSFSLINVETDCMARDLFSRNEVDPERMGKDKALHILPVRE